MSLVFLLLTFFPLLSLAASGCNQGDRDALLTFKNSLLNPEILHSWNASKDCCGWHGIRCDDTNRVTGIDLTNNLKGRINPSLANLTQLTNLVFIGMPNLVGVIPPEITTMPNLLVLIIARTGISGQIPESLSSAKKLTYLDLSHNRHTGPLPLTITTIPNLNSILFDNNQLTGTIPESYGRLAGANGVNATLFLSNNKLSGTIPSFAAGNYFSFDISSNNLRGDPSSLFGKDKSTELFNISNNKFSFNLSTVEIPTTMDLFDISRNRIYGGIPQQFLDATFLNQLNVSYNQLCGPIPTGWKSSIEPYTWDVSSFEHNKCLCGAPLAPCT